jgi:hypothetical protein
MKNERLIGVIGIVNKEGVFDPAVVSKLPGGVVADGKLEARRPRRLAELVTAEQLVRRGVSETLPGFGDIIDPFRINK